MTLETPAGHLWRPYTQMRLAPPPLEAVATHGTRIRLADGRELVDGIASWWTAVHGYNHPHIAGAVADQLARMHPVMLFGLNAAGCFESVSYTQMTLPTICSV
jgi:adenosylmethionine-8-amino-7-oxononanoate aminotransferase